MKRHPQHEAFVSALRQLSEARRSFASLEKAGLVLGNDNHIGDIGEYWARRYYEQCGKFKAYGQNKVDNFDIVLTTGTRVSVKTVTSWSKGGIGSQVKPLDGKHWQALFAIQLNEALFPEKVAIATVGQLLRQPLFQENERRRSAVSEPTKSYPRFRWWPWLDDYRVPFRLEGDDCMFNQ